MTTPAHSHQPTGLGTSLHLAEPTPRVHVPPAYGMRFGLAAVVLSLLGVPSSPPTESIDERSVASLRVDQRRGTSEPVVQAAIARTAVAQESSASEWDNWKPLRDLG